MLDLTGNKINHWIVIEEAERYISPQGRSCRQWLCKCVCGTIKALRQDDLRRGKNLSCGCLFRLGSTSDTALSQTMAYRFHRNMLSRVEVEKDKNLCYIEKGLAVCQRWLEPNGLGFLNFLEDMGHPEDGMSLDRIDNSLGYSPENCRWVSTSTQAFNRSRFKTNISGKSGVQKTSSGRWKAAIEVNYQHIHLGTYDEFEDAVKAREEAELKYFGFIKE